MSDPLHSLPRLLAFVRVAETRSFVEAARRLELAPSTISKMISRLEEGLGRKLFHRSTRSVSLTADGEALFDRCRRLLDDLADLEASVASDDGEPSGTLRVDLSPVFGRLFLVPIIRSFLARHPRVRVEMTCQDRRVDLAKEGIDVVVRAGVLQDATCLIARQLFVRPMIVCGSPDYVAGRGRPRTLEDLAGHDCLLYKNPDTGRIYPWRFVVGGREIETPVSGSFVSDDGEAVFDAALAGIGLTQTLTYMADSHLRTGRLVRVLDNIPGHMQTHWVCYRDRRLIAPKVRAFVDFLIEATADVPHA